MAWLVIMTDVPGRGLLGTLASFPYMLPGFAIALAWATLFRNERLGGQAGFLQAWGLSIPDWVAWGVFPIIVTLIAHYYSLGFSLIGASLASINSELVEAAEMTGAHRFRVLAQIILPVVAPAITSSALLSFATAISNFAAPALLGLPVRFYTISTRLYGSIRTGQVEHGYAIAIIMILIATILLLANNSLKKSRASYATLTGKGSRQKQQALGVWRLPFFLVGAVITFATTIVPGATLLLSSVTRYTNSLSGGFTLHFWFGNSDPSIADGYPGIFHNPQILDASWNTLLLGLGAAALSLVMGLAIGYVITRGSHKWLGNLIGIFSYIPFLIPGIAFGAIYIAQFGKPLGPIPALYGTFALLILAGAAHTLPFASQAARCHQPGSSQLEEAATVIGARLPRRLVSIYLPLISRGLLAGAVLVFVKMVRDLSLMVMLVTPTTSLLSVEAFRYASEGFAQFANAITVIVSALSIGATLLVDRANKSNQPWLEKG